MLRVGKVLLADARTEVIGVPDSMLGGNPRVVRTNSVTNFDAVVAQDLGSPTTSEALDQGIPVIIAEQLVETHHNVTDGAQLEGLARCLSQIALGATDAESASVAWTTPGRRLTRGPSLMFPAPIGKLHVVEDRAVAVAPLDGSMAGVVVSASGDNGDITYSILDDRAFLEGVILAAATICTVLDGPRPADQLGACLIKEAQAAGLVVASKIA